MHLMREKYLIMEKKKFVINKKIIKIIKQWKKTLNSMHHVKTNRSFKNKLHLLKKFLLNEAHQLKLY